MSEAGGDGSSDAGWILRHSEVAFECPWYRVRQDDLELPSGARIRYNVVEHPGWALVVPLLPDGRVVMERVFRWPLRAWTLECPSGGLDGDAPEAAARRELLEETGYRAGELEHLGRFSATNGYSDERYDAYLARDVERVAEPRYEPGEELRVELLPFEALRAQALRGEIPDGPTALALLLAAERRR